MNEQIKMLACVCRRIFFFDIIQLPSVLAWPWKYLVLSASYVYQRFPSHSLDRCLIFVSSLVSKSREFEFPAVGYLALYAISPPSVPVA